MIPDVSLSNLKAGDKVEPKELAKKVQAMFMEVMLKSMEDTVGAEDGLFGGSASSEIYRGMMREQFAGTISGQLKTPLEDQLGTRMTAETSKSDGGMRSKVMGALKSMEDGGLQSTGASGLHPLDHNGLNPLDLKSPSPEIGGLKPLGADREKSLGASGQKSFGAGGQKSFEEGLPVSGVVTSPQGWRHDPFNGEMRYHAGTDIAAPKGTPVKAVAGGRVIESGHKGTYGNAVVVQTDDGRKMLYAHNNQNFVQVGDRVARGEAIAEVGSTGRSTGPHVHFEVTF